MGEHKHNPTAIAAKAGELPPKPQKLSRRECDDRILMAKIRQMTHIDEIIGAIGNEKIQG